MIAATINTCWALAMCFQNTTKGCHHQKTGIYFIFFHGQKYLTRLQEVKSLDKGPCSRQLLFTLNSFNHKVPYGSKRYFREILQIGFVTFWKTLAELWFFPPKDAKLSFLSQKVKSPVWITEIFKVHLTPKFFLAKTNPLTV